MPSQGICDATPLQLSYMQFTQVDIPKNLSQWDVDVKMTISGPADPHFLGFPVLWAGNTTNSEGVVNYTSQRIVSMTDVVWNSEKTKVTMSLHVERLDKSKWKGTKTIYINYAIFDKTTKTTIPATKITFS